ncbi:SDR family NAD(P)-dependent oxidoreductase [uncultured Bradyrhizobium sp.]|uniref:SDR family NAD(P)-dependent oxidoreductase n=1 Tax=uncultured Bradyrhizobium sp. TaxID=199684 RepID=UPI0035CB38E3
MSGRSQQTVLVTGASRGIGAAVILRLAADGCRLALSYRTDADAAQRIAASARDAGAEVALFQADIADPSQALTLPEQACAHFGSLDAVVANAGVTVDGPFVALTPAQVATVLRTNLSGTIRMVCAALPYLRRSRAAAIVLVSSLGGIAGKDGQVPYTASKGGVIGLCQWLGDRLGPEGIRVNAVAPGFIATDMTTQLDPEQMAPIIQASALRRVGSAEEVAHAVSFLLRPGYIQSTTLRIDGGFAR